MVEVNKYFKYIGRNPTDEIDGSLNFDYVFSDITSNSNPSNGKIRLNNSNHSIATELYVCNNDFYINNIGNVLNSLSLFNNTNKLLLRISSKYNKKINII